jgi:undecaprenyl-diphosphatase
LDTTLTAAILGLLEGLTEFIPVSSTGHLLLAGHFLGFESKGKTFEVVIQLGAVLAILTVYAARLWAIISTLGTDPTSRRALVSVLLAFLPAAVIGVMAHDFIKTVLFETPMLIAVMLILGGIVLLYVDRMAPPPVYDDALALPLRTALIIGAVSGDDPRCQPVGCHDCRGADAGGEQAGGGGVFVLSVNADNGRCLFL